MTGAVYPFPLIEDGDFDIPNAFMTDEEGQRLASYVGQPVSLEIEAHRLPAQGSNVIGIRGAPDRRVVVTAHIDAKQGTPGALDNAAGISVLLLLAGLLKEYNSSLGVEIVALNGEDYYSAIGEIEYLRRNHARLAEVLLNINLDGVGYRQGRTAFSLYECPASLAEQARVVFAAYPGLVEGEPWYQGDHSIFVMNQVPALAFTSEFVQKLAEKYIHTHKDRPGLVDPARLAETALALLDLIVRLDLQ
jgi:aminopeptidase YwaD